MSDSFTDNVKFLIENNWIQKGPMSFVKFGIELFFDNSNSVEIYLEKSPSLRIDDVRIVEFSDIEKLIGDIEDGKYQMSK